MDVTWTQKSIWLLREAQEYIINGYICIGDKDLVCEMIAIVNKIM